jgi:transposase
MVDNGRGQEAAKRLLGTELEMALVSDQYAGYRFINS